MLLSEPLLRIEELRVATVDAATPILLGAELCVRTGEVLGLVGESGCGKSVATLSVLRLLPEGLDIVGGRIIFSGTDLTSVPEADMVALRGNRIGWVPQDPVSSLTPTQTIGTHLADVLIRARDIPRHSVRSEGTALLGRVGLPEPATLYDAYPHQLSGGMAQRVAIARALAGAPSLLIADEPTTALDVTTQRQILELLAHLVMSDNLALILVTHDLGVVAETADRIAVMYCGRVVETAGVQDFFDGPRHPYAADLLASVPDLDHDAAATPIRGAVPSMANLPSGCAFHSRCRRAMEVCRHRPPPVSLDAAGGRAWCFAPMDSA